MTKVIIIAEAGVNHNGSMDNARMLIDAAAEAGVDYVKFQTFKASELVSAQAAKADYQVANTADEKESQLEMLKKLELSIADHEELIKYCAGKGVKFFSTAFDLESLRYLSKAGLEMVKIPSGEVTNLPYLRLAATLFRKAIISTGMCTLDEIRAALDVFSQSGMAKKDITILHCNTEYPTPMTDVNLKAMLQIRDEFGTSVGYSDHTLGIEIPIAAVAMGASVIEKHFTLNRDMPGPDHAASLEPQELKEMVRCIRNLELAIGGSGKKEPSPSEMKNIAIARKSLHLRKPVAEGDIINESDLVVLRPGDGISPMEIDKVIGSVAKRNFPAGYKLVEGDI